MQEPATSPFARLNVWALTVSFALSALIIGLISLPVHLIRGRMYERHEGRFGGPPPLAPGASPQPWPMPGGPHAWPDWHQRLGAGHAMMMMHHVSLGIVLLVILSMAILAGIAGAIVAAAYNALLPKK